MNANDNESSTRKIGWGLHPIARGRYISDYNKTTEQIAYHVDLRDSVKDRDAKAREQRIIDSCTKHLQEIERKLGER